MLILDVLSKKNTDKHLLRNSLNFTLCTAIIFIFNMTCSLRSLLKLCCIGSLICSNPVIAAEIDQARMLDIARHVIKMQILNDPHATENINTLAELIVNSKQSQDTAPILAPIPKQGLAQHLREINTQGLTGTTAKSMLDVINQEIDQISSMFKSCYVLGTVQEIAQDLYAVPIQCLVPQPSLQAVHDYHQQVAKIRSNTQAQSKIQQLRISQHIFKQSETQIFHSELVIGTHQAPIYRPIIEDDNYFPNVVLDHKANALTIKKITK